jgi:phosphatidylglycerophosphate synthase
LVSESNRRPLASRSTGWAKFLAGALVRSGVSPNAISVASLAFAGLGAWLLLAMHHPAALLGVAVCIQARLLCNLLDGMVAIEGGKQSVVGGLYNEIPDRIADSLFIVALGYAAGKPWLGWLGALAAAVTAYIRVLGGALGLAQDFRGPLAKQHRMFAMTVGCVAAAFELAWWQSTYALLGAAWIIAVGALVTCVTRTRAIARQLQART